MQEASNFQVIATEAPSSHSGGVTIFYREAEHFAIKEFRLYVWNVISFHLVTGQRRWHVVGCHISPRNASTIEDVTATIRYQPYRDELLMSGDLNTNLVQL